MAKLVVFNQVTLDGYFAGAGGDSSWAYSAAPDPEWDAFVAGNASGGGLLVFGRVTYQLMSGYWPTPQAAATNPVVAGRMNAMPKVVFSKSLQAAPWQNTRLVKDGLLAEIRKLKAGPGPDMAILGSGSLVAQLAGEGLVDEYQLIVNPLVLGVGTTLFQGLSRKVRLKLASTRTFKNGKVLLCYAEG